MTNQLFSEYQLEQYLLSAPWIKPFNKYFLLMVLSPHLGIAMALQLWFFAGIVIPIVFNQSAKSWEQQPFRSCFPNAPQSLLQFIPEFAYFVFNLADLSNEEIRMLREYSALRSVLLAMKHYKNLDFLKNHFEEMIHFVEEHPEKEDLWQTIFAYILGNGELEQDVVNSILKNIGSSAFWVETHRFGETHRNRGHIDFF